MQNAKVTFWDFFIFWELQKILTFLHMRFGVYFADVWGGSERSKRAKSPKWHIFTTWRSKMTQVSNPYVFPCQINGFGTPKRTLALKSCFRATCTLWAPEVCAWQVCKGFCGTSKFCELLAPKCSLGALWAPKGPTGPRAGWLAGC